MSFAVVKNIENAFYVVPTKWLTIIDDIQHTFYPAKNMKKFVENLRDVQDDWLTERVTVVAKDCNDLKTAKDIVGLKCEHSNSEASEVDRKKKKTKKRLAEPIDNDFNNMFDSQIVPKQMKIDTSSNDYIRDIPQNNNASVEQLQKNFSFSRFEDNKTPKNLVSYNFSNPTTSSQIIENNSFNQESTTFASPTISHVDTSSNMMLVRKSMIDQLRDEIAILKRNQENILDFIDLLSTNMRKEFAELKALIKSTQGDFDSAYRPKVIGNMDELNLMESKLKFMPDSFTEEYNKMLHYYASSIKLPNKAYGIQNGYMTSLMSLYFDIEFIKSFKWASTKYESGFDVFDNHIKFFMTICNKVQYQTGKTSMFANLTEAMNSIGAYFKKIHANPRKMELDLKAEGTKQINDENENERDE